MKAAFIRSTGSPDVIEYGEIPDPEMGRRQVLIRVDAVAVNPIDTYVRGGLIAAELPETFQVGCDAAGVVEAVGAEVDRFRIGDRVWCTNQGLLGRQGTFAEKIAVDEDWCFPTPDSVSSEDVAACALVGVTAHLGLFREAELAPGETILVIGASGGVGSMVLQMAKAAGATVIATAGSEEKKQRALELGADVAINYQTQSISDVTKDVCATGRECGLGDAART